MVRIQELLIRRALPLLPFLFLGWEIGSTGKTISLPKILLPLLVGMGLLRLRREDWKRLPPLPFCAFGGYLAWLSIGSLAHGGPWGLWHLAEEALFVLFLVVAWAQMAGEDHRFWSTFECVGCLLALWAVVLWGLRVPKPSLPYDVVGTANVAAAFLVILSLRQFHRRRWAWLSMYLAGLFALGSAGAVLGALIGAASFSRRARLPLGAAAVALAAGALFVIFNLSEPTPRGPDVLVKAENVFWKISVQPRLYILRVSLEEIRSRPWVGHGLGKHPDIFPEFERRLHPGEELPWWRYGRPPKAPEGVPAHNDFLRIAIEAGLPAAFLWLVGMLGVLWEVRHHPLAKGILVAFLVQGMTEDLYVLSNYVPVLWASVVLGHRLGGESEDDSRRRFFHGG